MEEIKVGLNAQFPDEEQKAHTIVEEMKQFPAEGVRYGWAIPEKTNNEGIHSHPKTDKFDLLESFDSLFLTDNKWICVLATISYALNFKLDGRYCERPKRIEIIRKIFKRDNFKKMIFYSKEQAKTVQSYANIHDQEILDKIEGVYNAVRDMSPFLANKRESDKFRIVFMGADFYRKGGEELVEAFDILKQKYPHIELELHSSLQKGNYVQNSIYAPLNHLKTCKTVEEDSSIFNYNSFEYSREDILSKVYPRANLFILPSFDEGLPYVIQEAMAFGLPIITTNCVPAIQEVVEEEKNGLIIDIKEKMPLKKHLIQDNEGKRTVSKKFHDYLTKEIVEKISRILEDSNLRNNIKRNNLQKARDLFSFEKRNKIMKRIYEEAIQ